MRTEKYICDVCKERDGEYHFREYLDKKPDPSGNGYNNIYEYYDVCRVCMLDFVRENKNVELI
jgi:hypothetical protein